MRLCNRSFPRFFENAVKEQKWSVVGHPRFEDLQYEEDKPLTCKATFEIYPEIELKQYKELEVEEETPQVTEADIDQAIEEIREQAATFEVVSDRPAADGDQLTMSYKGYDVKAPASHPVEARDVAIELGGEGTVALSVRICAGPGQAKYASSTLTYPEDYPQKSLAGKNFPLPRRGSKHQT